MHPFLTFTKPIYYIMTLSNYYRPVTVNKLGRSELSSAVTHCLMRYMLTLSPDNLITILVIQCWSIDKYQHKNCTTGLVVISFYQPNTNSYLLHYAAQIFASHLSKGTTQLSTLTICFFCVTSWNPCIPLVKY